MAELCERRRHRAVDRRARGHASAAWSGATRRARPCRWRWALRRWRGLMNRQPPMGLHPGETVVGVRERVTTEWVARRRIVARTFGHEVRSRHRARLLAGLHLRRRAGTFAARELVETSTRNPASAPRPAGRRAGLLAAALADAVGGSGASAGSNPTDCAAAFCGGQPRIAAPGLVPGRVSATSSVSPPEPAGAWSGGQPGPRAIAGPWRRHSCRIRPVHSSRPAPHRSRRAGGPSVAALLGRGGCHVAVTRHWRTIPRSFRRGRLRADRRRRRRLPDDVTSSADLPSRAHGRSGRIDRPA